MLFYSSMLFSDYLCAVEIGIHCLCARARNDNKVVSDVLRFVLVTSVHMPRNGAAQKEDDASLFVGWL